MRHSSGSVAFQEEEEDVFSPGKNFATRLSKKRSSDTSVVAAP